MVFNPRHVPKLHEANPLGVADIDQRAMFASAADNPPEGYALTPTGPREYGNVGGFVVKVDFE
jgi:hypothetical protein